MSGHFVRPERVSTFRKLAAVSWDPPSDPTIYGATELEVGPLNAYLERVRARTGVRLSVTHAVARAFAVVLRNNPNLNATIRRGEIWLRRDVDIFLQVAVPPENKGELQSADLSGAVIRQADTKSTWSIAEELRNIADKIRARQDPMLASTKRNLSIFPPFIMRRLLKLVNWLSHDWNLDLSWLGLPNDPFGSIMVTSVGMMGIRSAWAPLFPPCKGLGVVLVGRVYDGPIVKDGQVVAAQLLPVTIALDHRIVDGFQASVIARDVAKLLGEPELLDAQFELPEAEGTTAATAQGPEPDPSAPSAAPPA